MAIVFTEQQANEYLRRQKPYVNAMEDINEQVNLGVEGIDKFYQSGLKDVNLNYGNNRYGLGLDLSKTLSDAFTTASQQRSSFLSQTPNIGAGQRESIAMDLENTIVNAYDSYLRKYSESRQNVDVNLKSDVSKLQNDKMSGLQSLYEDANKAQQTINNELSNQSKNYAALANAPMEYLTNLWKENPEAFENGPLSKYTYFEDGERKLINNVELNSAFFEDTENGKILTDAGREFYGTILYGLGDGSFDEYLKSSDSELYEWAVGNNIYGDSGYENSQGYSSNFDGVFGSLGLADIVNTGKYDTTNPIFKSRYENSYGTSYKNKEVVKNENLGSISKRTFDGENVYLLNDLKLSTKTGARSELNWEDVTDGEAETFAMTYNDNEYRFRITKDTATDDVVNKITSSYGEIKNKSIYAYNGEFYIGVVTDDGTKLRRVKLKGKNTKSAFDGLFDNVTD